MTQIVYGFDCNRCGHSSSHDTKEAARHAKREHNRNTRRSVDHKGNVTAHRVCSAVNRARARGLLIEGKDG
jgi:hypothetical protein